jgi:hypothetical protein
MPRVKASEIKRLQNVKMGLGGHAEVKKGAFAAGPLFQSYEFKSLVDALLTEEYNDKMEKLLRLGLGDKDKLNQYRQALKNPDQAGKYAVLRGHLIKMLDKLSKLVTDDPTVYQKSKAKLQKERDYPEKKESDKVEESLVRKSEKSGVPFEILAEVYNRGHASWNEGMKHNAEQNAFHRVNSYISGGKARELDADLIEMDVWDKPNPVKKHSKLSPKGKAKAKARARAAGRPYPNMVDNIWAARNEDVAIEVKPKISNKTIKREISSIPLKSKDPMSEKFETSEKQSKNPKDSSSRFDATDSALNIYKKDTPGENKIIKKLKEVTVAGFAGKKIKVANKKIRMADGTIKSKPPGKSGSSGGGGCGGGDGGGE